MLRSKLGELWRVWVNGRKLVGVDQYSNKYYEWQKKDPYGHFEERREVQLYEPLGRFSDYDPNQLPIEWRSWLSGTRRSPPSADEVSKLEAYREKVRKNAEAVMAAEQKERMRRATLGTMADGPSMDAFLRQLGRPKGAEPEQQSGQERHGSDDAANAAKRGL